MKNLLLILFSFSVSLFSQIEGWDSKIFKGQMTFNCVVQDQVILEIIDGEAKRFSNFQDGLVIGDKHTIKLTWWDIRKKNLNITKTKLMVSFESDKKIPNIDKSKEFDFATDYINYSFNPTHIIRGDKEI